jgi:hypothetical protein
MHTSTEKQAGFPERRGIGGDSGGKALTKEADALSFGWLAFWQAHLGPLSELAPQFEIAFWS